MDENQQLIQDGPQPTPTWPPDFVKFGKISRADREVIVTEKIDGTNAVVAVPDDPGLPLVAGSRNRWIYPGKGTDNYEFADFVARNEDALRRLGPGLHHGEWWGAGIARRYGLTERRWSLFNVSKWKPELLRELGLPACVTTVPILGRGPMFARPWEAAIEWLGVQGSTAAPGFRAPEGVVLYHLAAGTYLKWTAGGDAKDAPSPVE